MERAVLTRLETSNQGTFGRIEFGDADARQVLFTGEQPDRDNARNISCIPAGVYVCRWTMSPRYGRRMYLVDAVPGRSGIRIHPANLCGDRSKGLKSHLNGCIALGEKRGWLAGQKAVLVSRPAVRRLEDYFAGRDFELEVLDHA